MSTSSDTPDERRGLEASTAERLAEIVAGAEKAAKQVIDDAEAQAHRQLSDADAEAGRIVAERLGRVGEVADRLAAGAEAIRRGADELIAELRRAQAELGIDADDGSDSIQRRSHLTAVTPEADQPADDGGAEPPALGLAGPGVNGSAAGARLLATQMAVSGSSREEIDQRLRNGFEIEDTAPILDAILGPEG